MNYIIQFIGRRISFFRRKQRVSQEELAAEVSVDKSEIQAIEKGQKEPSATKLYAIAKFLKTRISDFFPKQTDDQQIATIYHKLHPSNQEKAFHFIRQLLQKQNKVIEFGLYQHSDAAGPLCKVSRIPIEADFVFYVDDASMESLILQGSTVFCRRQPTVKDGEIAIVEVIRLGIICKKIVYDFEEGCVLLQSLNPEYPDMTYEFGQVKIIGTVLNV